MDENRPQYPSSELPTDHPDEFDTTFDIDQTHESEGIYIRGGLATREKMRKPTDGGNQDSAFIHPEKRACGVGDGAGAHRGAAEVSKIAIEQMQRIAAELRDDDSIDDVLVKVKNAWLAAQHQIETNYPNPQEGLTTLSAVIVRDTHYVIAHVGDSRVYAVKKNGQIRQLTVDDSAVKVRVPEDKYQDLLADFALLYPGQGEMPQDLVDKWEAIAKDNFTEWKVALAEASKSGTSLFARLAAIRQGISKDLRTANPDQGGVQAVPRQEDDLFLFTCSDGLTDNLTDNQIQNIVEYAIENNLNLQQLTELLLEEAHLHSLTRRPGTKADDITIAAVDVGPMGASADTQPLEPVLPDSPLDRPEDIVLPPGSFLKTLNDREKITIGRDVAGTDRDFAVSDLKNVMSRAHCQISRDGDRFVLSDFDSSNGTYINGQEVLTRFYLNDGDKIIFGRTHDRGDGPTYIVNIFENDTIQLTPLGSEASSKPDQDLSNQEVIAPPKDWDDAVERLFNSQMFSGVEDTNLAHIQQGQRQILKSWGWIDGLRLVIRDPTEPEVPLLVGTAIGFLAKLNYLWQAWVMGKMPDFNDDVGVDFHFMSDGKDLARDIWLVINGVDGRGGLTGDQKTKDMIQGVIVRVFQRAMADQSSQQPTQLSRPTDLLPPDDFPRN
jgi:serine/threonine protein phosphatase PrpC